MPQQKYANYADYYEKTLLHSFKQFVIGVACFALFCFGMDSTLIVLLIPLVLLFVYAVFRKTKLLGKYNPFPTLGLMLEGKEKRVIFGAVASGVILFSLLSTFSFLGYFLFVFLATSALLYAITRMFRLLRLYKTGLKLQNEIFKVKQVYLKHMPDLLLSILNFFPENFKKKLDKVKVIDFFAYKTTIVIPEKDGAKKLFDVLYIETGFSDVAAFISDSGEKKDILNNNNNHIDFTKKSKKINEENSLDFIEQCKEGAVIYATPSPLPLPSLRAMEAEGEGE